MIDLDLPLFHSKSRIFYPKDINNEKELVEYLIKKDKKDNGVKNLPSKIFKMEFELYNASAMLHKLDPNKMFMTLTEKLTKYQFGLLQSKLIEQ